MVSQYLDTYAVYNYWRGKGYTPAQATGIIGNLWGESGTRFGLDTKAVGDGGRSKGLAQNQGPRLQAFEPFAKAHGGPLGDAQLDFMNHELQTTEASAGNMLKAARTPEDAVRAMVAFERPANPSADIAKRTAFANQFQNTGTMGGQPGMAPTMLAPPDTGTNTMHNQTRFDPPPENQGLLGLGQKNALPESKGLLGGLFSNPDFAQMLMSLGAGIAGNSTQGWGAGIGAGLQGASQTLQNSQDMKLKRMLLGVQMRPDIKEITLPNGNKISVQVGSDGVPKPLDTSGIGGGSVPAANFDQSKDLRKEYQNTPQYQTWAQAQPIYKTMVKTAGRNSKASDLNLVYGLAKIFDPGSVVREGEMVAVKSTASLPDWIVGTINSLNGGAGLTPETRAAVLREAHTRMESYQGELRPLRERYEGIAKRYGIPSSDLMTDLEPFPEWQPEAAPVNPQGGLQNFSPLPPTMKNGWTVIDGVKIRQKGL